MVRTADRPVCGGIMAGDKYASFQCEGQAGTSVETAFSQLSGWNCRVFSDGRIAQVTSAKPKWPDIECARQFLHPHFRPTRLITATSLNNVPHAQVHLKLESEMPTGSFKVRGAVYALHAEMTKRQMTEVVASSTGNHGAALAYAAT